VGLIHQFLRHTQQDRPQLLKQMFSGLSEKDILMRGTWSGKSTWQKHYERDIDPYLQNAKTFQESLFKK